MTIRMRAAAITIATVGALGLGVLGAGSALAGTSTVTAVTHTSGHSDTTNVTGACTQASSNGPIWAFDNLSRRFTITPETGPGNYSVTVDDTGSFAAVADPRTGACYDGHGSVNGTIQFDVQSSTPPDPAALPAQTPGDVSTSGTLKMLFGGDATIVGGGHYTYTYTRVNGSVYTQTG